MSLEILLQKIDRKLDHLMINPRDLKPKWVKSSIITDLTGWTNSQMRQARDNDLITWKTDSNGYWYDLNTLHPYLIKKQ